MAGIYIDESDYVSTAVRPTASLSLRKSRIDRGHQCIEFEMLDPRRRFLLSRVRLGDLVARQYEAGRDKLTRASMYIRRSSRLHGPQCNGPRQSRNKPNYGVLYLPEKTLEVKAGFSSLMGNSRGWCRSACVAVRCRSSKFYQSATQRGLECSC